MPVLRLSRWAAASLAVATSCWTGGPGAAPSDLPNLGHVTPTLLRGGQPTAEGLRRLAAMGVRVVVNLRRETAPDAGEQALVESLGMQYVAIPMHGVWAPTDAELAAALSVLCAHRGEAVFVHCRRGAERTGVVVAAARIAFQGWTVRDARAEMDAFGFRAALFPHYTRVVRRLGQTLAVAPAYAALRASGCLSAGERGQVRPIIPP